MSRRTRRRPPGFTLVELMVALVISMFIAIALMKMQTGLGRQVVQSADVGVRDAQTRAALDLVTRDLTSAGFLFGGTQNKCNALLTYDSAGSGYFVHHPVDAVAAASGATMGFAPSLTLTYPSSTSTIPSDVLVMALTTSAANFNQTSNPLRKVDSVGAPLLTGAVRLVASLGATAGDVGVLQVPVGGKRACMRVPLTTVTGLLVTSSGALMPAGSFYSGFSAQLAAAGFTDTLSNANIFQGRMMDLGAPASPLEQSVVYYVDQSGGFPVLMRATYSLLDDTPIGTPQSVAAGVASMQVLFGVDPGSTGAITAYENAATVTSNKHWDAVLSVRIALVTRTLSDDASLSPVTTSYTIGTPFAASVAVPGTYQYRRFSVQQTEVFVRNLSWMS